MSRPDAIVICQHRTCRKQGSANVLDAFAAIALPPEVEVIASGCLGQCGNGPMVLLLPSEILYRRVSPQDVAVIVATLGQEAWQEGCERSEG